MTSAIRQPTWQQRVHGVLRHVPTWVVYLVLLLPAVSTFALAFSDQLGADPVRELEHTLGIWALRLLLAGLVVTPLRQTIGLNLIRFRRVIGLAAFSYVVLHLGVYIVFDLELDFGAMVRDVLRRPYITIGMLAFVLLIPLAVTSTNAMIRRLGPKAWNRLHQLVYVAAFLGALHFLMLVKAWPIEPIVYVALALILIGWRLLPSRTPARA